MTTSHRQKENLIPNQDLNISAREIHALLQYMDFTFEHKSIDEFFEDSLKQMMKYGTKRQPDQYMTSCFKSQIIFIMKVI